MQQHEQKIKWEIKWVTSYARQYPFELGESTEAGINNSNHNYCLSMYGHRVAITFEEDSNGKWHKRVKIFPDTCNTLIPEVVDQIMTEINDPELKQECMIFSREAKESDWD